MARDTGWGVPVSSLSQNWRHRMLYPVFVIIVITPKCFPPSESEEWLEVDFEIDERQLKHIRLESQSNTKSDAKPGNLKL